MKKHALLIAGLVCAGLVFAAPPAAEAGLGAFVPKPHNIFNTPAGAGGTTAQQYQLSTFVESTLDAMAPGSVARLAVYDLNVDSTADAIIRTARRGVVVRVILDGHNISPAERRVLTALGSDIHTNRTYAIACRQSCSSAAASAMHFKLFTFSSTGSPQTARQISVIGSSNLTGTNQWLNWNQTQVLTDPAIYGASANFFDRMRFDTDNNRVFTTKASADGRYRVYLWPSGTGTSDPYLAALKSISAAQCRGTATGYGNAAGRTVIRVNMFLWSHGRRPIATELVRLRRAGCDVAVLYVNNQAAMTMAQSVIDILWQGEVPLYNSRVDLDRNGSFDLYTHGKAMMVSGKVYGVNNKVVWNGSANWTYNAMVNGNEIAVRTDDNATYDAFKRNFDRMQSWATRDTRLPVTEARPSTSQRRAVDVDEEFRDL